MYSSKAALITMCLVSVKWGKQTMQVEVDTNEDATVFKAQLYGLTSIPPDKQKVLLKGGKGITDTTDMKSLGLRDGTTMMLIGTPEDKQEVIDLSKKAVFAEDLTSADKARLYQQKTGEMIPVGLINLGNTCYMNSTIQCLRKVKELSEDLKNFKGTYTQANKQLSFLAALRDTYRTLDINGEPVRPLNLVISLKQAFPLFDEVDEQGHPKQQDAEECWSNIVTTIKNYHNSELIKNLFEIEFQCKLTNQEAPEEPAVETTEVSQKISCHIDNENNPINYLQDGIKLSLLGSIVKHSPTLGRDSTYLKTMKINKLPGYLTMHFVRFYWKKAHVAAGTRAGKAKILRNVAFPKILDIYDFCSEGLQKQLSMGRAEETRQIEEETKRMIENRGKDREEEKAPLISKDEKKDEGEQTIPDELINLPFGNGLETGKYHLVGVVTHKGRYADSGHYVGWTYHKQNTWLKFDDDIVSTVKTQDILALRGGGDWHTGYICLYRKLQVVPKVESPRAHPMKDIKQ